MLQPQEGPASVVVSRDGDDLVFWSSYDDYGKTIIEESRIAVANFVAKGEGPWPWYDLGDTRDATTCRRRQWRQRQPGDGSRPRARRRGRQRRDADRRPTHRPHCAPVGPT